MKESRNFSSKVYEVVAMIPAGKTMSYKEVARLAGSPKAFRAVGNILSRNYDPGIPCHRVIRSDGKAGGYNRGGRRKEEILEREAVLAKDRGVLYNSGKNNSVCRQKDR